MLGFNSVITFTIFCALFINPCLTRDYKFNQNNDFLLHESGGVTASPKKDYVAEFPALRTPSTQVTQPPNSGSTKQSAGKRDYVAPQRPTNAPSSSTTARSTPNLHSPNSGANSPKRDYVAEFPALRTPSTQSPTSLFTPTPSSGKRDYVAPQRHTNAPLSSTTKPTSTLYSANSGTTSPKRDYVSQFPTLKPTRNTPAPLPDNKPTSSKVKDLINFYDNNQHDPKKPSYSSILGRPDDKQSSGTVNPTPKPGSFSSVVSGPNTPDSSPSTKPAWTTVTTKPVTPDSERKKRPTVLPSSFVNNNNNQATTSNSLSDTDLQILSEELLRKDINNVAKYVTVNYQEKTTSESKEDRAPLPLLTVAADVWNVPTIQKFVVLLDNYERDTLINEYVTSQEKNEENAFMDSIMSTSVIRHLMNFLKEKGYVTPDPKQQRDFLKQMWFGMYSRGKGKISSSGFEHIFVSELKNGQVSGLHNWIYFSKEEAANRINYLGYLKYSQFNDKGAVLKMHFNQQGTDKPVDTMFIGTSPELEIALYTLCYVTRADQDCNLKLGTKDVNIITYNFRYRSKNYIGSGYPQI